jgi:hypothetical protein
MKLPQSVLYSVRDLRVSQVVSLTRKAALHSNVERAQVALAEGCAGQVSGCIAVLSAADVSAMDLIAHQDFDLAIIFDNEYQYQIIGRSHGHAGSQNTHP